MAVPFPGTEPVPFSEASGTRFAVAELAAEAKGSVRGGGFFWDEDDSPRLTRGPRVGALSDETGPQPVNPVRSTRLMSSIRRGQTGSRDGRDKRMPSGLSLVRLLLHCAAYMPFPISMQYPHMSPPRMRGYAEAGGEGGEVQEGGYEFWVLGSEFSPFSLQPRILPRRAVEYLISVKGAGAPFPDDVSSGLAAWLRIAY